MNTKHFTVIWLTLIMPCQSDETIRVADMTPESMRKSIDSNALMPGGPVTLRQLIADAINLERMDLIYACFINAYTAGDTYRAIAALPDNELRQKAAIMIMRIPTASAWPPEGPLMLSSSLQATGIYEPFISTVATLLPGETLTKEMVVTQVARDRLADRLLAALVARGVVFSETEKSLLFGASETRTPTNTQSKEAEVRVPESAPAVTPESNPPERHMQGADPTGSKNWIWLVGGAILAALAWWKITRNQ